MKQTKHFKRTALPLSAKSMLGTLLLLIAMLLPQGVWAANHYDAGYGSTATTYSAAGIKFKITAVRMYNYQGNNSQFRSNPLVTITAGEHTHTFYLGSLTSNTGKDTFYYNGEGNENPYKGSGSFSKVTYQQTVDGIPVKAYFDNQKNEQSVSTNPDKTYKDNGDGSSKWCTADLTIEIGVQTAAMVTIAGNWGDYSDGINKTETYSWPFDIPKHTCNSDIQSDTYRKSAATCTDAAVYYNSCSLCGAAQSGTFTSGSALGHGSTGYTESYSWTGNAYNDESKDTKKCTFTLTCNKCSTTVVNGASLTCTKTAHKDAECTKTGSTTYQATGSYTAANSKYNYSKTVTNVYTVAVLGHSLTATPAKAETCTTAGNNAYWTCSKCNKIFSNSTATTETTVDAQTIAALGHSYGVGSWSWADDGHSATCTRTCGRTGCTTNTTGHTSSKSVTLGNGIASAPLVAPNCGELGTTRYTATATVENVEYRDTKDIKDIPVTGQGHTFNEETDPHHTHCTVCDHSFFRYTSSTGQAVNPFNANELKGAGGAKLEFTNTYVDGQGVMEFKKPLVTIGPRAFYNCSNFTGDLTIPNTVTTIENQAFQSCRRLTGNLIIPNSVTSIGNNAFGGCQFRGNLIIPNSVTSIGGSAFSSCNFSGNLILPSSVISIGRDAFMFCNFNNITLQSIPKVEDRSFFHNDGYDDENDIVIDINFPITILLSGNSCVYKGYNPDFPEVSSVTAPCSLDLTDSAVEKHPNLTHTGGIRIVDEAEPATCTETGLTEGSHCNLCHTVFVAQEEIPAIGHHTFNDVTDPHHTLCTVCDHSFFRYTSSTEDVVNPNNADALLDAYGTKLEFTNTYDAVQGGVMEFDGTLKTIADNAFMRCKTFTGDLTIPNSVTSIGNHAFDGCFGFNGNLTIPNTVTSIGSDAFYVCSGFIGNLNIPNSVTSIGSAAFFGCSGFTGNLTIPNTVASIGSDAFYGCSGFNGNLTIPNSVTSIGGAAFQGCSGFTGNLTIPNSVTSIEIYAFDGCSGFNGNLTIPNSVTSIGNEAFRGCSSLTGIEFQSVPQIGSNAFYSVNCTKAVVLSDDSNVYKESNPDFPTVASVTAPCTLDLTGSVVETHANLTRTHECTVKSETETYLASAAGCGDATYYYKCANCDEHGTETWAKAGTGTGQHTFADDDPAKSVCTVCNHGFFWYTSGGQTCEDIYDDEGNWSGQNYFYLPIYLSRNLYDAEHRQLNVIQNTFNRDSGNGSFEFDGPIVHIGDRAFAGAQISGHINLPNTTVTIGKSAFECCYGGDNYGNIFGISGVDIPISVTAVGENAFANNGALRSIKAPCHLDLSNVGINWEEGEVSITRTHTFAANDLCETCKAAGKEPAKDVDVYQIANIGQLVWFATSVNGGNTTAKAELKADIEQGDAKLAPIGTQANPYHAKFNGNFHTVTLAMESDNDYQGFFGVLTNGAEIYNLTTAGSVMGKSFVGGIAGGTNGGGDVKFINVGNEATVTATNANAGGILGVDMGSGAKINMINCYNAGAIKGGKENGGLSGWAGDQPNIINAYNIAEVENGDGFLRCNGAQNFVNTYGKNDITEAMLTSGELCAKLDDTSFRQEVGTGHPVFDQTLPSVVSATVSAAGYATYVAGEDVKFNAEGLEAYVVSSTGKGYAELAQVTEVPRFEAVVLKADGGTYYFNTTTDATTPAANELVADTWDFTADGSQYALAKKTNGVGFYKVKEGVTIPAGKAYLQVSAGIKEFYGFWDDDANGIEAAPAATEDGIIYNLAGQKLSKAMKGINIINGKKVMK